MDKKVFIIGFNKTGTSAIDFLFKSSGYKTRHCSDGKLAKNIWKSVLNGGTPLLKYKDNTDVFSDLIWATGNTFIEANQYFKEIYNAWPDSYFILNDRNEDAWIASRFNHYYNSEYLVDVFKSSTQIKTDHLVETRWRTIRRERHTEIINFFQKKNFLHFNIDSDDINKLIEFVKDDYTLESKNWLKINVTNGEDKCADLA